ncbi:MAG: cytochrome-c oxidase, cbb3-type subunit III [Pseudomonadota bacterium]|jgi:cytochrome c oxidase cbb3-type subunit 3
MQDFLYSGVGIAVAVVSVVSIIGCGVFLYMNTTRRLAPGEQAGTTGHTWDDDLQEWNNPLPRWWMWLFYITIVFALAYLALYPGLAAWGGALGWSSGGQYAAEARRWEARHAPMFEGYLRQDIPVVARDPAAREMGQRLFLSYCSQCHGADGGGSRGFPSLRDGDWLWGGEPAQVHESIANGRRAMMPALADALGRENLPSVVAYVRSLSGLPHDAAKAADGKPRFEQLCAACHGVEGRGNPALGAPNLADRIWLYGGSEESITETLVAGRAGVMPAQLDFLGPGKVHLLAAYVWGLSRRDAR